MDSVEFGFELNAQGYKIYCMVIACDVCISVDIKVFVMVWDTESTFSCEIIAFLFSRRQFRLCNLFYRRISRLMKSRYVFFIPSSELFAALEIKQYQIGSRSIIVCAIYLKPTCSCYLLILRKVYLCVAYLCTSFNALIHRAFSSLVSAWYLIFMLSRPGSCLPFKSFLVLGQIFFRL